MGLCVYNANMTPKQIQDLKSRLAEVTPPDWRAKLTTRNGRWVVYTISEAPFDLLAVDAAAYPDHPPPRDFVKICPTAYENFWDESSEAIIAIWKVLCQASRFRELWIGAPGKPFTLHPANC